MLRLFGVRVGHLCGPEPWTGAVGRGAERGRGGLDARDGAPLTTV